jgi:hypothetical protein
MMRRRSFYIVGASALSLAAILGLSLRSSPRPTVPIETALPRRVWEQGSSLEDREVASGPILESSEREFLWQVEHHGNLLNRYGFSALAEALRRADAAALNVLLSADFTGWAPQHPREVRLESDYAQVVRQEDAGWPPLRLDRNQFVARLLGYRRLFPQAPKVKLALMALSPSVRGDLDGSWQGTCQLRTWGETGPGRPGEVILYLGYQLPRPTQETLGHGGWLRSVTILQTQEAQALRFLLHEVTAARGLDARHFHDNWSHPDSPPEPVTGGVYLADYDRDGFLDMLITDVTGYVLYRGRPGGRFEDVTTQMGLLRVLPPEAGPKLAAAFADLDGDGWEDLILGGNVYRNEEGRRFRDVTERTNLHLPNDTTGLALADFDRDGRIDFYVTRPGKSKRHSWIDGRSGDSDGNHLYRNLGNWRFEDVTAASSTDGGHRSTFTALWFDADNDGWPDLYVINEFGNGVLLHNQGNGRFQEQALVTGPGDFGSMGAACGDINNDGRIDLYVANMYSKAGNRVIGNLRPDVYPPEVMARLRSLTAGSQLYLNRGDNRFEPVGAKYQVSAIGWAYGPALVDLDNDGWLDLYATCGYVSRSRSEPDG